MKNKVQRGAARLKRVYTEPWTVRSAKINTAVWTAALLVGLFNFTVGILDGSPLRWVWITVNTALLFFDFTMLKWSVTGLLWRKAKVQMEREDQMIEDRFYAILNEEYKSDRSN